MKKVSIVYWSGTGNTKMMAEAIAEGARTGETDVSIFSVDKAELSEVLSADCIALGCPSMGAEVLEEDEMEPFVTKLEKHTDLLRGKPLALFGSFDWGDGQWMFEWEDRMKNAGVKLVSSGLQINNTPDSEGLNDCKKLGILLASS